jgi:REP element-mobilizing transposase RayT
MTYNPAVHHRHSIRLPGYDYSQAGAYFITLCTYQRKCIFGEIVGAGFIPAQMKLNEYGQIAYDQWQKLPERFENIELDAFAIMPNHIHGIIIIPDPDPVGAGFTPALDDETANTRVGASPTPTLMPTGQPLRLPLRNTIGDIVGAYKSLVAKECLKICKTNKTMGKIWQRNYYEHITRDEEDFDRIATYIQDNPSLWEKDTYFSGRKP